MRDGLLLLGVALVLAGCAGERLPASVPDGAYRVAISKRISRGCSRACSWENTQAEVLLTLGAGRAHVELASRRESGFGSAFGSHFTDEPRRQRATLEGPIEERGGWFEARLEVIACPSGGCDDRTFTFSCAPRPIEVALRQQTGSTSVPSTVDGVFCDDLDGVFGAGGERFGALWLAPGDRLEMSLDGRRDELEPRFFWQLDGPVSRARGESRPRLLL
jgi:hypothetical protein